MIYLFLIFSVVVLIIASAITVNAVSFRPPQKDFPIDGREVGFFNGKRRLCGYLWNETGTRGLLILAHGMGTGVGYHMPEIHHFADEGFRVFAFEYSGYGKSEGRFYGFPQAVSDLKSAIEFIDDGSLPVILLGHSMGGYAVCTVGQCLKRRVGAIVAYAPFYSSAEAIAEMTRGMPRFGWLFRILILPVQKVLFGRRHKSNGVDGLHSADAPTLILQGSCDDEVSCTGCSMYAHRVRLADAGVSFRLIENDDSNGHMTVIRKKRTRCVNGDTMQIVDSFLDGTEKTLRLKQSATWEKK